MRIFFIQRRIGPVLILLLAILGNLCYLSADFFPSRFEDSAAVPINAKFQRTEVSPVLAFGSASVSHTFSFSNDSGRHLILQDPVPGCGCAKSALDTHEFPPNASVKLTVSVKIPKQFEGTKKVWTLVQSADGVSWQFELVVPVVQRLTVPRRVVAIPAYKNPIDPAKQERILVHVTQASSQDLPPDGPRFTCLSPNIQLIPVGHHDTELVIGGVTYPRRIFEYELARSASEPRNAIVHWTYGGQAEAGTTLVEIPEPADVEITPARLILRGSEINDCRLNIRILEEGVSVRLLAHPDCLEPRDASIAINGNSSTIEFTIANPPAAGNLGYIELEVLRRDQAIRKARVAVINAPYSNQKDE